MRVSDIWDEVKETTGTCSDDVNYRAITRAVQLLANKALFDPLIGCLDFTVDGGFLIALPRDVKTPLRVNINNNPSFSRSRLFEFTPNTEGSVDGPEVGWQWHERGYSCIQDERKLPSKLSYVATTAEDEGKSLRVRGTDTDGRYRDETIIAALSNPTPSNYTYGEVRHVTREATASECFLHAETGAIARYYANEEQPEYRVIKLSQTGVAVRMLYRKHVFKITAQDDIIPLHSEMAVIRAVKAVRLFQREQQAEAEAALASAVQMITEEQGTRDENVNMAGALEIQTAINKNITCVDVLTVADIYDMASDILGGIGRQKIFDRITDAIMALQNKAQWESGIGEAILNRVLATELTATARCRSTGLYVLPRFVGSVLAVNVNGSPGVPRNNWFEYHLNGTGETRFSSGGTWQDCGKSVISNALRIGCDKKVVAVQVCAVCENALDENKAITIYGIERLSDGREVEVYRDGVKGWSCPCVSGDPIASLSDPYFVRIDRIKRDESSAFVSLFELIKTVIPATPEFPATDITELTGILTLEDESPWTGPDESRTVYGRVIILEAAVPATSYTFEVFSDSARETVIYSTTVDETVTKDSRTVVFTVGDLDFLGVISGIASLPEGVNDFLIVRIFTPIQPAVDENYSYAGGAVLGYWYPDEIEPSYRMIKIPGCCCSRVRIKYRKKTSRVTSLYDVINLRSRLAIENMLRAIATQSTDPKAAMDYEAIAVNYLEEEQKTTNPHMGGTLQFPRGLSPGHNENIQ